MITLGVSDLARSIEFYEKGLGFPKMEFPLAATPPHCFVHPLREYKQSIARTQFAQGDSPLRVQVVNILLRACAGTPFSA